MGIWIGAFEPPRVLLQSSGAIELINVLCQLWQMCGFSIMHWRSSNPDFMEEANGTVIQDLFAWQLTNETSVRVVSLPVIALNIIKACLETSVISLFERVLEKKPWNETHMSIAERLLTVIEEETGIATVDGIWTR